MRGCSLLPPKKACYKPDDAQPRKVFATVFYAARHLCFFFSFRLNLLINMRLRHFYHPMQLDCPAVCVSTYIDGCKKLYRELRDIWKNLIKGSQRNSFRFESLSFFYCEIKANYTLYAGNKTDLSRCFTYFVKYRSVEFFTRAVKRARMSKFHLEISLYIHRRNFDILHINLIAIYRSSKR